MAERELVQRLQKQSKPVLEGPFMSRLHILFVMNWSFIKSWKISCFKLRIHGGLAHWWNFIFFLKKIAFGPSLSVEIASGDSVFFCSCIHCKSLDTTKPIEFKCSQSVFKTLLHFPHKSHIWLLTRPNFAFINQSPVLPYFARNLFPPCMRSVNGNHEQRAISLFQGSILFQNALETPLLFDCNFGET